VGYIQNAPLVIADEPHVEEFRVEGVPAVSALSLGVEVLVCLLEDGGIGDLVEEVVEGVETVTRCVRLCQADLRGRSRSGEGFENFKS